MRSRGDSSGGGGAACVAACTALLDHGLPLTPDFESNVNRPLAALLKVAVPPLFETLTSRFSLSFIAEWPAPMPDWDSYVNAGFSGSPGGSWGGLDPEDVIGAVGAAASPGSAWAGVERGAWGWVRWGVGGRGSARARERWRVKFIVERDSLL